MPLIFQEMADVLFLSLSEASDLTETMQRYCNAVQTGQAVTTAKGDGEGGARVHFEEEAKSEEALSVSEFVACFDFQTMKPFISSTEEGAPDKGFISKTEEGAVDSSPDASVGVGLSVTPFTATVRKIMSDSKKTKLGE